MPPGAKNLGDNRFAMLAESPQPKRKKPQKISDVFPSLPPTKQDDPKFIVLKSENSSNTPLSKISCFRVHNAILTISKDINKISELRDGSLLLLVKNKHVAEKFIRIKTLPGIGEVSANYHQNLNAVKGTIYAPFLIDVPDEEIIEGLSSYNVTSVYKFKRNVEGVEKHTGVILLTFDSYCLPTNISIAWRMTSVRPYIPNPMRCKTCQKLGHTTKYCKSVPICVTCSLPLHGSERCKRVMCANCLADHPSSSNICPSFQQGKEILKIKTLSKCSMREAIKNTKTTKFHLH